MGTVQKVLGFFRGRWYLDYTWALEELVQAKTEEEAEAES